MVDRELGRFEVVGRQRPWALVAPAYGSLRSTAAEGVAPLPQPAPYAALVADLGPSAAGRVSLVSGPVRITGRYDPGSRVADLVVSDGVGEPTLHRSRRHGRLGGPPDGLGLTLTGTHATLFSRDGGGWVPRARVDLAERRVPVPTTDPAFLAGLAAAWSGTAAVTGGAFGQLGLRDLRFASTPAGDPVEADGRLLLTATHAGPGFFDTAHTGVWSLDPESLVLEHRGDLFFARDGGVLGDHSTHLVRDGDRWRVATATWGDFALPPSAGTERRRLAAGLAPWDASRAHVEITLAETATDLTTGRHVLGTRPLLGPAATGSVAVWDPHLVHDGREWLLGFVTARRFFSFHPALARGAALDRLVVTAAADDRIATEGTTLWRTSEGWRVLASDGRDGRRGRRKRFPVLDLDLADVGALDAPYPSNLPWPNLARTRDGVLMATFDGTPSAGRSLLGYGTHGDVVLMRSRPSP